MALENDNGASGLLKPLLHFVTLDYLVEIEMLDYKIDWALERDIIGLTIKHGPCCSSNGP